MPQNLKIGEWLSFPEIVLVHTVYVAHRILPYEPHTVLYTGFEQN